MVDLYSRYMKYVTFEWFWSFGDMETKIKSDFAGKKAQKHKFFYYIMNFYFLFKGKNLFRSVIQFINIRCNIVRYFSHNFELLEPKQFVQQRFKSGWGKLCKLQKNKSWHYHNRCAHISPISLFFYTILLQNHFLCRM